MPETYLPELRRELVAAANARSVPRRRTALPRRVLVGTLTAAVTSATFAFMLGAGSDPEATANDVRSDGLLLRTKFAVFGKPSDAQKPGNPFTAAQMGRVTLQASSVHRLDLRRGDVWVGAGSHQICLSARIEGENARGGSCARPAQVADSGLYTLGRSAPTGDQTVDARTEVAGLVPDGVTTITFHFDEGPPVLAPVVDNGIFATLHDFPARLTFLDDRGAKHSVRL